MNITWSDFLMIRAARTMTVCLAFAFTSGVLAQCASTGDDTQALLNGTATQNIHPYAQLCPAAGPVHVVLYVTADLGCHSLDATNCGTTPACGGDPACNCNFAPTSKYVTLQLGPIGNTVQLTSTNTDPDTSTQPHVGTRSWLDVPANGRFFEQWAGDNGEEKEYGRSQCQGGGVWGNHINEHRFFIPASLWNSKLSGGVARFVVTISGAALELTTYCNNSLGAGCSLNGATSSSQIVFAYTCAAPAIDCNTNNTHDACETDCDSNGTIEACQVGLADCNTNGSLDRCEPVAGDCNTNLTPDRCELSGSDCNTNLTLDRCEPAAGDCNTNVTRDVCELTGNDCNTNGSIDRCEPPAGDCNSNLTRDACELAAHDCDTNLTLDACQPITSECNSNGTPDVCETDCNTNGQPDLCDILYRSTYANALYWSEATGNVIKRANLATGTGVTTVLSTGAGSTPAGIAFDLGRGHMYWTEYGSDRIRRANINGTAAVTLASGTGVAGVPYSIDLDLVHSKLVWCYADIGTNNVIEGANLDGTGIQTLWTMTGAGVSQDGPYGVALDVPANKMYWTHARDDVIYRSNLDGTSVTAGFISTGANSRPIGMALDLPNAKIYWTEWDSDRIGRANLDGTSATDIVTSGVTDPDHIVVDSAGGKIYWTEYTTHEIMRANLDGTGSAVFITGGLSNPSGIALIPPQPAPDCDTNGVLDECEVAASDCNTNNSLDTCESCAAFTPADVNCDGAADGRDVQFFVNTLKNPARRRAPRSARRMSTPAVR